MYIETWAIPNDKFPFYMYVHHQVNGSSLDDVKHTRWLDISKSYWMQLAKNTQENWTFNNYLTHQSENSYLGNDSLLRKKLEYDIATADPNSLPSPGSPWFIKK